MAHQNSDAPPSMRPPPTSLPDNPMSDPDVMPDPDMRQEPPAAEDLTLPLATDGPGAVDDIALLDSDIPARIFTPPPHIAARFNRSSAQVRRRGSAASSRRNSISSVHSRSSLDHSRSSSCGAPQSKHAAQHARRANIIADRKARLANRAAHAEQVRLRAAQAKAALRDTSLSDERAQAAAQAREKNLAEIAANCAEEVKRAKAVAESMKEKREQEHLRLRQQIQQRLSAAKQRREELLLLRNTASKARSRSHGSDEHVEVMPQVAEAKESSSPALSDEEEEDEDDAAQATADGHEAAAPALTPEEAAFKILHWWRSAHRRKVIADFQQLGLTVDGVRDTSFDTVVELLSQEQVLLTTGQVLRLCGIQDGESSSVKSIVAVRAFLSAFLILGHPTEVLSNKPHQAAAAQHPGQSPAAAAAATTAGNTQSQAPNTSTNTNTGTNQQPKPEGHQEQELVGKARDLLICFETILSRLVPANNYTPPPPLANELSDTYQTFYEAFVAWKARDASALVEVMLLQFVELDAILHTVEGTTDKSVSATYKQSVQHNQTLLLMRIKKLVGPEEAKRRVVAAVNKARKARAVANKRAAASSKMKPRQAEHAVDAPEDDTSTEASRARMDSGAGRAAADSILNPATLRGGMGLDEPGLHLTNRVTANGETFTTHPLPDNRVIIHELAINGEFHISVEEYKKHQADWLAVVFDRMRTTMNSEKAEDQEEHFFYLVSVAEVIRSKLRRMTIPGKTMYQFINELLDTQVAHRQFARGTFSYERFFESMGQLIPKLCAPFRDDEVSDLVKNKLHQGDYVDRLKALYSFCDVLLVDHVNFMIHVATPEMLLRATEYETREFSAMVKRNQVSLSQSTVAWCAARAKVVAEATRRDPEGINHPKARPTPAQVYAQLLVDVFTQLSAIPKAEMPEMLLLDHKRALKWGSFTRRIVTAGALLLQSKNLLKRDVRMPWKTEAHRVMAVLGKAEADVRDVSIFSHGPSADELRAALTAGPVVDGVMAALETGRSMPAATKAQLRVLVKRTLAASAEAAATRAVPSADNGGVGSDITPQEPVLRLLLHRLRGHLLARLTAASSAATRQSAAANDRLTGLGLAEFVDKVREMIDELARTGNVDRETHSEFWEAVAARVQEGELPAATATGAAEANGAGSGGGSAGRPSTT